MVTPFARETVSQKCKESGKTISEYVCKLAANFVIPDSRILKLIKIERKQDYKLYARGYLEKNIKRIRGNNDMNKKNGASTKTAQFHLRVSPAVYQNIKAKADEMSMSVSDYVTFVTTRYDIEEISLKLDKMSEQLEDYNSLLERYNELQEKYNDLFVNAI